MRNDVDVTPPEMYPPLVHLPYFDRYGKQVVKQADGVLAMHGRGDSPTLEEQARDFAYYEARTVRDSSVSACAQAVIAADVGHRTGNGLHLASLARAWTVAVARFGGMHQHDGRLTFAPRLPPTLSLTQPTGRAPKRRKP
jgi:alpha,alpha-trehalose phosphorylase